MTSSLIHFPLPTQAGVHTVLSPLTGSSMSLALCAAAQTAQGLLLVITRDITQANQIQREINFFKVKMIIGQSGYFRIGKLYLMIISRPIPILFQNA